jgi:hypothetical protein
MTGALRRSLMLIAITIAVGIAILVSTAPSDVLRRREMTPAAERPPNARPVLLLLTSLPLIFSEDFSLRESGSPALAALSTRYWVTPISVAAPAELARGRVLMMAQPPAQPPEDLVALDRWVRRGGHVLLFADPMLEWPSKRPLGDPLRPPPMFADTGLLRHWGLRLDGPEKVGGEIEKLGGFEILTASPGRLSGTCQISSDRLVARCAIGKGKATVIGDADMLDVAQLGSGAARNLDAVLVELAQLEQR